MNSSHAVAIAAFALLIVAVICDLRSRTIPDSLSVALCVLGLLAAWRHWHDVSLTQAGLGLGLGFAIGAALFYLGAMGGGDAKIAAGLGAVCGWALLLEVLFATALVGGLLSVWAKRRQMESLPYAPAFAGGFALTMSIAWTLPPSSGLWSLVTGRGA
ncbi:MAG: prepilin peptidase [Planctomycetota bacterium]